MRISPSLNHYDCNPWLLRVFSFFFFLFFFTHHSVWKEYPELQKIACYLTSHLHLMMPNLNYYVLVVSWCYYKYLKGSIYHWDTVYQHKWISCVWKGQSFRCINMWVGNPLSWHENQGNNKKQGVWLFTMGMKFVLYCSSGSTTGTLPSPGVVRDLGLGTSYCN